MPENEKTGRVNKKLLTAVLICVAVAAAIVFVILLVRPSKGESFKIPEGGRTLNASYYCEKLSVGYVFTSDGFGYRLIGKEHTSRIAHYIIGNTIYIEEVDYDSPAASFDFTEGDGYITIADMKYDIVTQKAVSASPESE